MKAKLSKKELLLRFENEEEVRGFYNILVFAGAYLLGVSAAAKDRLLVPTVQYLLKVLREAFGKE